MVARGRWIFGGAFDSDASACSHYAKYFPGMSKERPLPTLERLADWWAAVGQVAAAEQFEPQRFVVLPLPPPWLDDPERRRE